MPTAVTTVAMVKPFFSKNAFNHSRKGRFSTSCSLPCSSWSFLSVFSVIFHERVHGQKVVHFDHLQSSCPLLRLSQALRSLHPLFVLVQFFLVQGVSYRFFDLFGLSVRPSALKTSVGPSFGPITTTFPFLTSRVRSMVNLYHTEGIHFVSFHGLSVFLKNLRS